MVLDATKRAEQRALLEAELDSVGIRLNKEPPYVALLRNLGKLILTSLQQYLPQDQEGWWHEDFIRYTPKELG